MKHTLLAAVGFAALLSVPTVATAQDSGWYVRGNMGYGGFADTDLTGDMPGDIEAEGNVALKIAQTGDADAFEVAGRGELQLSVLIETMRREGFELTVGRPRVVMQQDENGTPREPIEEVTIDVDDEFTGAVIKKLSERKAELVDMRPSGVGRQRLVLNAPTRGLIGYLGELMTDTRGTAIMNRVFHSYANHMGDIPARRTGVLLSNGEGDAVAFALWNLEDLGPMFIYPGTKVYRSMIVGEHTRGNDL